MLGQRWSDTDRLTPFDAAYSDRLAFSMQALADGLLHAGVPEVVWIRHPIADPLRLGSTTRADPGRHVPIRTEMQALADPTRRGLRCST